MASLRAFMAFATAAAILFELVMGASYTVGGPTGAWNLNTNFQTWASSKSFSLGDNLNFVYDPSIHDVLEVSASNYGSCDTSSPIKTYKDGNTTVTLQSPVTYFICGTPTHCSKGMKVEINTGAAGSPSSSPSTPATSPPPPPPSPSGAPAANGCGLQAMLAMVFGFGMLMPLAL